MLIRSQDKQKLVSLDNAMILSIQHDKYDQYVEGKEHFKIKAYFNAEDSTTLGVYSSLDKAEAVMDDIQLTYNFIKQTEIAGGMIGASAFTYQMPDGDNPWFDRKEKE